MGLLELVLGLIKANSAVRQNTCIEVHSLIRDLFSIVTYISIVVVKDFRQTFDVLSDAV